MLHVQLLPSVSVRKTQELQNPSDANTHKLTETNENQSIVFTRNSGHFVLQYNGKESVQFTCNNEDNGPDLTVIKKENNMITYNTNGIGKYSFELKGSPKPLKLRITIVDLRLILSELQMTTINNNKITKESSFYTINFGKVWTGRGSVQLSAGSTENFDKIHVGAINNLIDLTTKVTYKEGKTLSTALIKDNVVVGFPVLDSDSKNTNDGGNSIFVNHSSENQSDKFIKKLEASVEISAKFPENEGTLATLSGELSYKTFIVAYSEDMPYSYTVLGEHQWKLNVSGVVNDDTLQFGSEQERVTGKQTIQMYTDSKEVIQAKCEVRPPTVSQFLQFVAGDASAATTETKPVCTFIKKPARGNKGNVRKRAADSTAEDDTVVVQKAKADGSNPMVQSTKDIKHRGKEDLTFQSSGSAMSAGPADMGATAYNSLELKDPTAEKKKKEDETVILAGDEAMKVYKGLSGYTEYIEKREQTGVAKGTGIRSGPVRGNMYARAISRMDYQPDVCKDYKETGFCGYGDSCKFMHDRGDYKNSVELEKEWQAEQDAKKAKMLADMNIEETPKDDLEDVPFACSVCRKYFTNPVKTKSCKHYFCEKCAIRSHKCQICGAPTNGIYGALTKDERSKLERAMERHREQVENNEAEPVES